MNSFFQRYLFIFILLNDKKFFGLFMKKIHLVLFLSALFRLIFGSSFCYAGGSHKEVYKKFNELKEFSKKGYHFKDFTLKFNEFWMFAEENSRSADVSVRFIGLVEKAQLLLDLEKRKSSSTFISVAHYYTHENIMETFHGLLDFCDSESHLKQRQARQACIWAAKLMIKRDQYVLRSGGERALDANPFIRNEVLQQAWDALETAKDIAYQGKHSGIPLLYQCNLLLFNRFLPVVGARQIEEQERLALAEELLAQFKMSVGEQRLSESGDSEDRSFLLQMALHSQRVEDEKILSRSTQAPRVTETEEKDELEKIERALKSQKAAQVLFGGAPSPGDESEEDHEKDQEMSVRKSQKRSPGRSHGLSEVSYTVHHASTGEEQRMYLRNLSPLNNNCFFAGIQISRQEVMDRLLENQHTLRFREWLASEIAEAFFLRVTAPEHEREHLLADRDLENELDHFALEYSISPTPAREHALLQRCQDIHVYRSYIQHLRQSTRMVVIRRNQAFGVHGHAFGEHGMLDVVSDLFHLDIQIFEHPDEAQGEELALIHHSFPSQQSPVDPRPVFLSLSTLAAHFSLLEPGLLGQPGVGPGEVERVEALTAEVQGAEVRLLDGDRTQRGDESEVSFAPVLEQSRKRSAQEEIDSSALYMHAQGKSKKLECPTCKIFFASHSLKKHEETHQNERKHYQCGLCPDIFLSEAGLKIHRESKHEKIKYECLVCGKKYNQKSGLKHHQDSKHGDQSKSHTCEICEKKFFKRNNLKRHQQTVHGKERDSRE